MHRIASIEQIRAGTRNRKRTGESGSGTRGRVRVTMQDGDSFILSASKAARLGLEEGGEVEEDVYAGILQSLRSACMLRCGTLLGSRDYSEHRMTEKLREAGYPAPVIEEAVEKLKKAGYLDDRRFAQSYVRSHLADRSRLRIMRDLAGKGISGKVIEEAFAEVGEEENLEEAQRDQVVRLLKKRGFDPAEADSRERQKTMAFLYRKGYPSDLIRSLTGCSEDW